MNFAILGAGNIANKMAFALNGLKDEVCCYAVASRTIEKAQAFATQWNFEKAYGSYEELVKDENVDLIYIATPHSHHYETAKLCIEHGKNVLVEKAFTVNRNQAEELIRLAQEKKVFLAEAMWTRYMPAREIIEELLENEVIGKLANMEAEFSMSIAHVERLRNPELAGGTLLDLGVYALTFADMFFGNEIESIETLCEKYHTGVDATDEIVFSYRDGRVAKLRSSMVSNEANYGKITGTQGSILVYGINNCEKIEVYDTNGKLQATHMPPKQINGYEYEVLACKRALEEGKTECEEMTWEDTLRIMKWMDLLRSRWNIVYPFEKKI